MGRVGVGVEKQVVASRIFLLMAGRFEYGFRRKEMKAVVLLYHLVLQALVLESELVV